MRNGLPKATLAPWYLQWFVDEFILQWLILPPPWQLIEHCSHLVSQFCSHPLKGFSCHSVSHLNETSEHTIIPTEEIWISALLSVLRFVSHSNICLVSKKHCKWEEVESSKTEMGSWSQLPSGETAVCSGYHSWGHTIQHPHLTALNGLLAST